MDLPQWLGAAILAAIISLLGFAGKFIIELTRAHRERQKKRFAKLVELCSLLNASFDIYKKQNSIAHVLCTRLLERPGLSLESGQTMDAFLSSCYTIMNETEKETHSVIRGYSNALHDLNTRMLTWLQNDFEYKTAGKKAEATELASQLNRLETHLYLWIAKYNVWIPTIPRHCLVYLKDEAYHGTGFPKGIEAALTGFLRKKHQTSFPFNKE
ncbi:hypothetical protein [Niabella aquatica]